MLASEVQLLQHAALFKRLPVARLKLLAFAGERMVYQPGELIFRCGDPSDAAYFIFEGEVEATIPGSDEDVLIAQFGANEMIGEVGVFTGNPRAASALAKVTTTVLRIPGQVFIDLIRDCPDCAMGVTTFLAELVERMVDRFDRVPQQ